MSYLGRKYIKKIPEKNKVIDLDYCIVGEREKERVCGCGYGCGCESVCGG